MRIKFHELDEIKYDNITDDHLLALDTVKDTYKVKIATLKRVFSCDTKITAVSESLSKQISEVDVQLDELTKTMNDEFIEIRDTIQVFNNNLNEFSKRLSTDEKSLLTTIQRLNQLLEDYEQFKSNITSHLSELDEKYNTLSKTVEINKSSTDKVIQDLDIKFTDDIKQLTDTVESNKSTTDEFIKVVDQRLDSKIDRIHQELLNLIDSYHHTTH